MIIAIIPARGASKRLPGKNVRPFAGHPLIAYSIAAARTSNLIEQFFVSTDDNEIRRIAEAYGAEVIIRPPELATDTAKTGAVIQHAVNHLITTYHVGIDAVVLLQPTNVLRGPGLVDDAIRTFLANDVDSVITVSLNTQKSGCIADGLFQPDYIPETRSQDLRPSYYENGLVYVTKASVAAEGDVFGKTIFPFEVGEPFAVADIDTQLDFEIAEFVFQRYRDQFVHV